MREEVRKKGRKGKGKRNEGKKKLGGREKKTWVR